MALVELDHVSKVYRQGAISVRALDDVSLSIREGEFTALVGPSGSGKTTLLNQIGALDNPDTGTIHIAGERISGMPERDRTRLRLWKIGFVFQEYNLIGVLSALENVEYVLMLRGERWQKRRQRAREILAEVGLEGLEDRLPHELSGGQQQRVAVARAMAGRPALILADEPTANLDSHTGEALLSLMQRLNEAHGTTFIFSTHDPAVMSRARRLIRMKDGRVVASEEKP